jgi:hydrogenase maturation protein HypF
VKVQALPRAAPQRVLAAGAWLKNTACLLDGAQVLWSEPHGDLGTPEACVALRLSIEDLQQMASGPIAAVAHDLHPGFESTRQAVALAGRLGVPAVPVQHHHAHIAVVQAEHGSTAPVIALALDGVGLGSDGRAWGGELLSVAGARWQRLDHLTPLAMPGGDIAAREPWRMGAAALHAMGRSAEIVPRFAPAVGERLALGVRGMLERGLNCPSTTSAGRWFDAIAALLGLSVRQPVEAEAAMDLQRIAEQWLAGGRTASFEGWGLNLLDLTEECLERSDAGEVHRAAALFHIGLADALASAAAKAAREAGVATVALAGGCMFNRLLAGRLASQLRDGGLEVQMVQGPGPGDAGVALGQAWVAAHTEHDTGRLELVLKEIKER